MDYGFGQAAPSLDTPTTSTPIGTLESTTALDISSPEVCVICLELLVSGPVEDSGPSAHTSTVHRSEKTDSNYASQIATAHPCQHAQYHLACLGTWLSHAPVCPLCKTTVLSITLHRKGQAADIISLPLAEKQESTQRPASGSTFQRPRPRRHQIFKDPVPEDPVLTFRRQLYLRQVPSLYLGRGVQRDPNHRHIRRPIRQAVTPTSFSTTNNSSAPDRLRLATIWIRRELQLFPFLQPSTPIPTQRPNAPPPTTTRTTPSFPPPHRRTTPHYLLPYILSILQQIDLRGAAHQAVSLLSEYLGKTVATLFCHELHAFLSSGAESVARWDGEVQYWFEEEGELRDGRGAVLGRVDGGWGVGR